jgi:hypothetical protein
MSCPHCHRNQVLLERAEKALAYIAKSVYAAQHQESDAPFWAQACLNKINAARNALIELHRMKGY